MPADAQVLLDEDVRSVHLSTEHAAHQLVERLIWAIDDAESAERATDHRSTAAPRPGRSTRVVAGA
jgi:hypothetical protein